MIGTHHTRVDAWVSGWLWNRAFTSPLMVHWVWETEDDEGLMLNIRPVWWWRKRPHPDAHRHRYPRA